MQATCTRRSTLFRWLAGLLLLASLFPIAAARADAPSLNVPYVPTPQAVVDRMLAIAGVKRDDLVYDLGSGDGRIVITAAKRYGAKGVGIDMDPQRVREAQDNAARAGVAQRVQFLNADLFKADLSKATVVTLYLLGSVNRELRPQLWRQLPVGARVVSHDFDMGPQWPPENTEHVAGRTIYYWTIREEHKAADAGTAPRNAARNP